VAAAVTAVVFTPSVPETVAYGVGECNGSISRDVVTDEGRQGGVFLFSGLASGPSSLSDGFKGPCGQRRERGAKKACTEEVSSLTSFPLD